MHVAQKIALHTYLIQSRCESTWPRDRKKQPSLGFEENGDREEEAEEDLHTLGGLAGSVTELTFRLGEGADGVHRLVPVHRFAANTKASVLVG